MICEKKDRRKILTENAKLPPDHPDKLSLHALQKLGVITRVSLVFWYRGKEYVIDEFIDDDGFSTKEMMGLFVDPFDRAVEQRDKELGR